MNLGFVLFDYFPFGGLERDCLRIAGLCADAGHQVSVFTRTWQGERPPSIQVETLGRHGFTIPARNRAFVRQLAALLPARRLDCVAGFNKMPGLDVYYGADPCYAAALQSKPAWKRALPRYRHYLEMERAVFARGQRTVVLQYIPRDIPLYQQFYGTEDRFHVLPPNARRQPWQEADREPTRARLRTELGAPADALLLLFVGSDFQRKGLDRILLAMAALEPNLRARTHLAILGRDEPGRFQRLAHRLGLAAQAHFLGGRLDAPDWMLAADLMLHPARSENTGSVLVEALHFGLPVLATEVCGYTPHILTAHAGRSLPEPFEQAEFNQVLQSALTGQDRTAWRAGALAYAASGAIYGCHERAAELIQETAARRAGLRPT